MAISRFTNKSHSLFIHLATIASLSHFLFAYIEHLNLQLLAQPFSRSLDTIIDALGFRALALAHGLLSTRLAANNLRHRRGPVFGGDALRGEVLQHMSVKQNSRKICPACGVSLPRRQRRREQRHQPPGCHRKGTPSSPSPWSGSA